MKNENIIMQFKYTQGVNNVTQEIKLPYSFTVGKYRVKSSATDQPTKQEEKHET